MRFHLPTFASRYRFWFLLIFISLNALLLFLVYRHETVPYPTGWDAPYYILRIREFLERGIVAQRFGFVLVMSVIHLVTRIPVMTEVAWASPVLMVLTATGVASLVYAATQRSLLGFSLTFAVTLWSPLNVILSTGTFDNAFGMVLLFLALWILRWTGPTWWRGIVLAIVAGLIGWTHIETYALFLFIVALYEVLRLYRHKSIRLWWAHEYDIITAILSGVLVGVWHWAGTLDRLFTSYTTKVGPGGNASIPYAQSATLTSVINYLQTGIPDSTVLWIVLVTLIVLGYRVLRRHDRATDLFISYILVGYAVLLFAIYRSSIPINRAILLVPANALIGYGIYYIIRLPKRLHLTIGVLVVIWAYFVFVTPTAFIATIRRLSPSISPTTFAAYQSLATYVRDHRITTYVVLVDIPTHEPAASAYYQLWTNWLSATRSVGTTTDQFCIYLGSLTNYRQNVQTLRDNQQEYNDTSLEAHRCFNRMINAFPGTPTLFVIQGMYFSSFSQPAWSAVTEVITPNLGLINLSTSAVIP
ncbi:MAG: hypothetical protein AAB549_03085 [Patescibacteria group bacterium]|mgnify:CR=1 FL=1